MGWGQVALDYAALIPGYGELSNAAQAGYHGAATVDAIAHGDTHEAIVHGTETLWNGLNSVPGIHEAMEPVHAAELGYDAAAASSGNGEHSLIHDAGEGIAHFFGY
jgi:hypothetical protein